MMKNHLLVVFLLLPYFSFSQYATSQSDLQNNKATLFLVVKDMQKQPVAFLDVWLEEKGSGEVLRGTTNQQGKVEITLLNGQTYALFLKGMGKHSEFSTPPKGTGRITKSVMYRGTPPTPDMAQDGGDQDAPVSGSWDTIPQRVGPNDLPTRTDGMVKVQLYDNAGRPVRGVPARLVGQRIRKVYTATTDSKGEARFMVQVGQTYGIGVESVDDIQQVNVLNKPGVVHTRKIKYVPTNIQEIVQNDTVRQNLGPGTKATTSRTFVHIQVNNLQGQPLPNEEVTLVQKSSGLIYFAETGSDGMARFLLPKANNYELHFRYDRGVDLLKIASNSGFETYSIEYSYMGSAAIEAYYANAGRDAQGFITEFRESKIERLEKGTFKVRKTEQGFDVDFKKESPISTPTLSGNDLIVSGGFYSPELYCIDAKTGAFKWGASLAEGGASTAVVDDGVVLVNTESCTIYAIDAITGNMLWSKWLSPYLFTTPSVKDGKVFTVYGNNLSSYETEANNNSSPLGLNRFVLACFDLRSGKIVWQNFVDGEGRAAPVVADDHVYVSTVTGSLYQFDVATGKDRIRKAIDAIAPPTIVNNKVYVSTKAGKDKSMTEVTKVFAVSGLQFQKDFTASKAAYADPGYDKAYPCLNMNYTASQITWFRNRNYQVVNDKLVCTNPENGAILWSVDVSEERAQASENAASAAMAPIITSGKVMIATQSGKLQMYDPVKGDKVKEFTTGGQLWSAPMVHKGWIYAGNEKGTMVSINTKDPSITGWGMWGFNGSHNPVVGDGDMSKK